MQEKYDIHFYRYGGEEFLLAFHGAENGLHIAEELREAVCGLGIVHQGVASGVITISVGVALRPAACQDKPEELIFRADQALYRAKEQGKHCVVLYEEEK